MTRNRDPFATALDSLRRRLMDGAFGPGAPIVILDEARRLGLSTTPVREALAWLSGAGLVDHSPTGGYRAPGLDAGAVRNAYAFRNACLLMSLERASPTAVGDVPAADPQAVFAWVVGRCGDAALLRAFETVDLHLGRLVRAERQILDHPAAAVATIRAALIEGRRRDAAAGISAYHRERIAAAAALVFEAVRSPHPLEPD
ncbi:GntR family transcriptional regulator [Brevundimonas sp.]|uniref:GntR family transcriptional regulator n=1 Tax=Brevundimonas sp. TaxID=1871086 RepID=UPI00289CCC25|nr:GntR family transcriptional regulator [Brevundimonas sp.]